ncbi:MAG: acetolactate synthase small subunit [Desulfobacteraceae bacterium]
MTREKHILTMLVENEPGVTARITGLFAGRGYNIETICGAPTANPEMSRITITTWADSLQLEQCMKQIRRLTNVIKLRDMTGKEAVKRELAIVCVHVLPENREDINAIMVEFNAKLVDSGKERLTFEVTEKQDRIDELLMLLRPFGIKKLARSGLLALYRENG